MRYRAIITGIFLVILGGFSLLGGGFSWTEDETVMEMGPMEATAETRKSANIPPMVAGALILVGVGTAVYGVVRGA